MANLRTLTCSYCRQEFEWAVRPGTTPEYCSDECRKPGMYAKVTARRKALVERRCPVCDEMKPTSEFGGLTHPYCKPCNAAYARELRANHTPEQREHRRRAEVAWRHGTTVEGLDALLESQDRRCGICQSPLDGDDVRQWHVDHDHACCTGTNGKTGKDQRPRGRACGKCIRGILCSNCNGGLGLFRDDPEVLKAAITYLTRSAAAAGRRPG